MEKEAIGILKPTRKRMFKQFRAITQQLPSSRVFNHYKQMKKAFRKGGRQAVNEYIVGVMPTLKPLL